MCNVQYCILSNLNWQLNEIVDLKMKMKNMLKQWVSPYFLKFPFLMKYILAMRLRCMLCKCICIHLYLHLKTTCICRINQRLCVSVCVHKLYCGCALHNVQSVITNSGLCTFFSSPTNFPLFTFFSDCRKITMMISTVADDDDNDD